jgi:hypothetical protein
LRGQKANPRNHQKYRRSQLATELQLNMSGVNQRRQPIPEPCVFKLFAAKVKGRPLVRDGARGATRPTSPD